jgi:hypothetical protein
MAEMIITLRRDPQTGKQDIVVKLHSDADALPHEHEQQHRALVEKLIEGGVLKAEEVGKIVVERQEDAKEPATPVAGGTQGERRAQSQGR